MPLAHAEEKQIKCWCILKTKQEKETQTQNKQQTHRQKPTKSQIIAKIPHQPKVLSRSLVIAVEHLCRLRRALGHLSMCLVF